MTSQDQAQTIRRITEQRELRTLSILSEVRELTPDTNDEPRERPTALREGAADALFPQL